MNPLKEIHQKREASELEAASFKPIRNRLHASTLTELLDERKNVSSAAEMAELAKKYNVDLQVLERLARFVNSPSIGEKTVTRTVDHEDGMEKITMQVCSNCMLALMHAEHVSSGGMDRSCHRQRP